MINLGVSGQDLGGQNLPPACARKTSFPKIF
jgi:hypothetical protein